MPAPCFSPSPSDAGDRATSPALSSSSRTTTSIPTDVSDISSLDGDDDYEVIDGPVPLNDDDGTADHTSSLFQSQHGTAIASEIDGSSFLAPFSYGHDDFEEDAWRGDGHTSSLHASTSLATLSLEPDHTDSQASSQLRFPDPMDESFQENRPSRRQSSRGVQCSDDENEESEDSLGAIHLGETLTPRLKQTDEPFNMQTQSVQSDDDTPVNKAGPTPAPSGHPFNWDKKIILVNVGRAIMGLIVIILSTGVMPVWPGYTLLSRQAVQTSHSHAFSWKDSVLGHTSACSTAMTPSKALIVPPRNSSSVLGTMTSLVTRPSSKAIRPSTRSKELMRRPRDCNALSVYMTEVRFPIIPACLDYVEGTAICKSARKMSRKKSKAAKESAQIITTSALKKWHDYVKEMNEMFHSTSHVIVEAVRHQSLTIRQRKAKEDPYFKAWKFWYQLTGFMKRTWVEWMQDFHVFYRQLMTVILKDSAKFKQDAEAGYQSAREAMDRQYKQAVIAARLLQKTMARDMRDAQGKMAKGAQEAQKSWTKAWKEAGESATMQKLHKDVNAAKERVSKAVNEQKKSLRKAAVKLKQAQVKKAAKKRMTEVQQIRAKHRELMSLVREQNQVKHRASRLMKKGKVAIYRKAIQSVQARHQMENMLGKMAGTTKKNIHKKSRKVKKSHQKRATSGG